MTEPKPSKFDLGDLLDAAFNQLEDEGHSEDCILRCLRSNCDYDHACDVCPLEDK